MVYLFSYPFLFENWKALGIVAECEGLTRADYLEQIVREGILPNITRNEHLTLPCNTWIEDTSSPYITPSESHPPQRKAARMPQLEALEALRDSASATTSRSRFI